MHWLVLKSFIGPFILIFFIVLFILLMQFLWRYIDDLVGKGLELSVIGELLLYTSSSLVPMALPLSILMSALMTFGNMGEFYELTAIKASGISLQRIMMPLVVLIIGISFGAFFFANNVLPYTNLKMRSLLFDVRNQRPEISITPGTFYSGIDGYNMRVDSRDPNTNMMYNIKIYDHTQSRGNTSVTIADSGKMTVTADERNLIFTLYNGHSYIELENERNSRRVKTYPHRYDKFEEQQFIIELVGFDLTRTDESLFKDHYTMLNLNQLETMKDSISTDIGSRQKLLHNRLVKGEYFKNKHRKKPKKYSRIHPPADSIKNMARIDKIKRAVDIKSPREAITEKPKDENKDNENPITDSTFYGNIIEHLTLKEKTLMYETALTYARNARTYVDGMAHTIDSKIRSLRRFEIEWHRKFTIAFACFVFLLIGAPLGAIVRKGGLGLPMVLSTFFFIFYYIISLFGEKMVRESILPGYQGVWISSASFFIVGMFLTYKATTDAAILNFETYSNFFKKFQSKKKLFEILRPKDPTLPGKELKTKTILSSLSSLMDSTNQLIDKLNNQFNWADFILSLLSVQGDGDILMFERLYMNTGKGIGDSSLLEIPSIRSKFEQLPAFNASVYTNTGWRVYSKFIMLAIPPLALFVAIKHAVRMHQLRTKLKNIYSITEELLNQIIIHN